MRCSQSSDVYSVKIHYQNVDTRSSRYAGQSCKEAGKPTGDGGGGGGCWIVDRESVGRVYLGRGEASIATVRS